MIISATSSTSNINFLNSSGSVIMGLSNTNILINYNMTSYGTVIFLNGLTLSGSSSITAPNNNKLNIDGTGTAVTGHKINQELKNLVNQLHAAHPNSKLHISTFRNNTIPYHTILYNTIQDIR